MIDDVMPFAKWPTAVAASQRSITNSGAPAARVEIENVSGAPWNSRDTTRWVPSRGMCSAAANPAVARNASVNGVVPDVSRRTPLGRPVVPDVYDIFQPQRL